MFIWIIRILVIIAGPIIGWFQISNDAQGILIGVGAALLIIFFEIIIERVPLDTMIAGGVGALVGLIVAKLLDYAVYLMDNVRLQQLFDKYSLLIKVVLAYLGLVIAIRKKEELDLLDRNILIRSPRRRIPDVKVLDTSVIIDGRIADIVETKFLTGVLLIPRFILEELQLIADSPHQNRRARGRRGLEILTRLQENSEVPVKIIEKDYSEIKEIDFKLVRLAKELGAKVVTTDFNLNKVAMLQGVTVLNINDLSSVLRPVVLPGERLNIFISKEGKEHGQGVGYLDDGTMIVVEDGYPFIGRKIEVNVMSILQTSSGRMVFARSSASSTSEDSLPGSGGEGNPGRDNTGKNNAG